MPEINRSEMAAQYGLTLSFLNSNKELKGLFDKAVKNTWDPARFQAAVRNTSWYRRTSEPYRQAQVLRKTDPSTYKQRLHQVQARVRMMATEFGASVSSGALKNLAEHAFEMGLDDNQLRWQLSDYVKYSNGRMLGQAGQWEQELRQHMRDMGVGWTDKTIRQQVSRMVRGTSTVQDAMTLLNEQAMSKYQHLSRRIEAGETVYDIASPYIQEMSKILEVNPESISLENHLLKRALDTRDKDGDHRTMTISEFGDLARKDPRWKRTDNAKAQAATTVRQLGEFFGQSV